MILPLALLCNIISSIPLDIISSLDRITKPLPQIPHPFQTQSTISPHSSSMPSRARKGSSEPSPPQLQKHCSLSQYQLLDLQDSSRRRLQASRQDILHYNHRNLLRMHQNLIAEALLHGVTLNYTPDKLDLSTVRPEDLLDGSQHYTRWIVIALSVTLPLVITLSYDLLTCICVFMNALSCHALTSLSKPPLRSPLSRHPSAARNP